MKYNYLGEPKVINGVKILSLPDIVAMKLNAICTCGQRSKDFIDIYFLLDYYEIEKMISFYKEKYSQQNEINVLKSLVYYDDVDLSNWPVLIQEPKLKWIHVKKKIEFEVLKYTRTR